MKRKYEGQTFINIVVMGLGQKFLTQTHVGSGQPFMVWVRFGKFTLKMSNFQFFSLRVKKNCFGSGRKVPGSKPYLLRVKSKLGLGQGPSLQYSECYCSTIQAFAKKY